MKGYLLDMQTTKFL